MAAMLAPLFFKVGKIVIAAASRSVANYLRKEVAKGAAKQISKRAAKNARSISKVKDIKNIKPTQTKPKAQTQTKPTSQTKPKTQQKKTQQKKKPDDKKQGNILTRNKGKILTGLTLTAPFVAGQFTGSEKGKAMPKKSDVKTSDNKKTSETKPLAPKQDALKKLKDIKVKDIKTKPLQQKKKVDDKPKRTNITAGGNVGFGLKGNIFASNEDERKRLMAKFGGTGSAAARAAMKGTQGNIKSKSKKGHTDMRKGGLFYG